MYFIRFIGLIPTLQASFSDTLGKFNKDSSVLHQTGKTNNYKKASHGIIETIKDLFAIVRFTDSVQYVYPL